MKAIIDGFKYNTETATIKYEKKYKQVNGSDCCIFIYQNSRGKLFTYEYMIDGNGEIHNERIIPKTVAEIKEHLVQLNEVDVYEDLFGEVEEAWPEKESTAEDPTGTDIDEVTDGSSIEIGGKLTIDTPSEIQESETNAADDIVMCDNTKLIASIKLGIAVGQNSVDKAKKAIIKGGKVTGRTLSTAIVTQNIAMVNLIAKANPDIIGDKHYKLALRCYPDIYCSLCDIDRPSSNSLKKHLIIAEKYHADKTVNKIKELLKNER